MLLKNNFACIFIHGLSNIIWMILHNISKLCPLVYIQVLKTRSYGSRNGQGGVCVCVREELSVSVKA